MHWLTLAVRAGVVCALLVPAGLAAAERTVQKPEAVGFSSERLKRIDEMVERRITGGDISGAVTAVARRGRVVHFAAHGVTDLESRQPMTRVTLFRLASTTKPVTAVAVLMLMEEGKLKLTDTVGKYIPEFILSKVAGKEGTVGAQRSVTILDLLTHTSGLATGGPGTREFAKLMEARKPEEGLAEMVPRFGAVPLDFQPGTQWRYSGLAGFDIAARIVEIASGMPFDEFLRKRLFAPLGMNSTWFTVPESETARLATIYQRDAKGLKKMPPIPILTSPAYKSGAGGLASTVGDFLKLAQMLCNGGQLRGVRILSPRTVDLMFSNHVGDLFNGQIGRPPKGMGFGLGGEVVLNAVDARVRRPDGSFGWDGAYGTYWWVNRKEQMVAVLFVQTPGRVIHAEFDNAIMQALVE